MDGYERLQAAIGEDGVVISTSDAIEAGLYGPRPQHPEMLQRVGDTLLLSTGPASFPYRPARKEATGEISPGAHGSLTAEEMRVPLIVWRCGR